MKIINIEQLDWQEISQGNFAHSRKPLSLSADGQMLGTSLYKLEPGKKAFPYHCHLANEEAVFILEGVGTLRTPEAQATVKKGDYVALPKGRENAHQIFNSSDAPLVYLCMSTMIAPDVIEYPDSNKVGVMAGSAPGGDKAKRTIKAFYPKNAAVGYFEGEK